MILVVKKGMTIKTSSPEMFKGYIKSISGVDAEFAEVVEARSPSGAFANGKRQDTFFYIEDGGLEKLRQTKYGRNVVAYKDMGAEDKSAYSARTHYKYRNK